MESWGPGMHSFNASTMNFGKIVQHTSPLNKQYWHFLIPPSGPASDSWECCNIEAWGPRLHSFDASTMNFGEVVQHTSPLNKHYWHFLIPPSGPASDSWVLEYWGLRPWLAQFWCQFWWILGKLFNILALWINVIGIFWYHFQGQLLKQEGAGKCSLAAKVPTAVNMNFRVLWQIQTLKRIGWDIDLVTFIYTDWFSRLLT